MDEPRTTRETWALIEKGLGILALCAFSLSWILQFWFYLSAPRFPDSNSGATYSFNFHGTAIYLSHLEQLSFYLLMYGSGILFAAAIVIDFYVDPFRTFRK